MPEDTKPSDDKKIEFTQTYATDVKARFEKLEASLADVVEFAKKLGHQPKH